MSSGSSREPDARGMRMLSEPVRSREEDVATAQDDEAIWSAILAARNHYARSPESAGNSWQEKETADRSLLWQLYGPMLARHDLVIAQLGQTLDGRIATISGDSNYVTGELDRQHLHRLRALVDAVIVGAGTVCADDPLLTVRSVPGPQPVRVVLDPRGRIPAQSRVLTDASVPTLWIRSTAVLSSAVPSGKTVSERSDPVSGKKTIAAEMVFLPEISEGQGFVPADILAFLRHRGLRRVLVEGGGLTVSRFLQAGVLDRFFVTVAPMLLGSGRDSLTLEPISRLASAIRPKTRIFSMGSDVLFDLDLALSHSGLPSG